jgi:hypothetical protein
MQRKVLKSPSLGSAWDLAHWFNFHAYPYWNFKPRFGQQEQNFRRSYSSFLLSFFITFNFSIDNSIALRTKTTTIKDGRRRTNGKTLLLNVRFSSCLRLTITFYISHLSFDFRFATTIKKKITMATMLVTIPPLPYIAH